MNNEWKRYAESLKQELMLEKNDPVSGMMVWFSMKYRKTMYESPKKYRFDYAFNDGNWFRFPTEYRTKTGKPKAIFLNKKKDVVVELMYFCRFQRLIGVTNKDELVYHMVCFLGDTVKIYKQVFDPNKENVDILYKIADRILNSDCKDDTLERLKDDRDFCINPERLKTIDAATKRLMISRGRRMKSFMEIREKYNDTKSRKENAVICGVAESTIARFRRHRTKYEEALKMFLTDYDE